MGFVRLCACRADPVLSLWIKRLAGLAWPAMQGFGRALGHVLLTEATTTLRHASDVQMFMEEAEVALELGLGRSSFASASDTSVGVC